MSQAFQPPDQRAADAPYIDAVKVICPELAIVLLALQQVISNDQECMGYGHDCALGSPS